MALPRHPDHDEEETLPAAGVRNRRTQTIIVAVLALVVLMIVVHLTGVIGP
jgi:predicted nucleic acid-binding Zn ribbon protein